MKIFVTSMRRTDTVGPWAVRRAGPSLACHLLGRRVRFIDDDRKVTNRYYYDGVNEIADYDGTGAIQRWYLHGVSYVDERLMMYRDDDSRPYYYVIDRMYNP